MGVGKKPDYYSRLQVHPKAHPDVIKAAHRALMNLKHPDKGGSDKAAAAINEAYDVLGDEAKRDAYDDARGKNLGGKLVGDYRILHKTAEGGFGKTYKAEHLLVGTREKLVEEFQCPGCVAGMNIMCGHYELEECPGGGCRCKGHVVGTTLMSVQSHFALGLPKGFCRTQRKPDGTSDNQMEIRLWLKTEHPKQFWDKFNIPVWALEQNGFLFVRTACPRVGAFFTEVIEGGKREILVPNAIDVSEFLADMD
jgi:hypothetical protein